MEYTRNPNGTFKQTTNIFSIKNFNDGYVDADGRFRVRVPNHPRAYSEGYIFRSIIAYELYHNTKVPLSMDVHHKDGNRLNDSKENLVLIKHSEHSSLHNVKRRVDIPRVCKHCGKEFLIKRWRLKDTTRGIFCTKKCFHVHGRSETHRKHISEGLQKSLGVRKRTS